VHAVTEGEEKPLKYPVMFRAADLVLINKADLLPHLDVDLALFEANLRRINPTVPTLAVSARTGLGVDEWCAWLRTALRSVVVPDWQGQHVPHAFELVAVQGREPAED
jgi:hydrogenase nickel incorporation protein HypB